MEKIIDIIKDVNNNQLLVLLFSGGIVWTIIANIRSIISNIWGAILACISFTVNSVSAADYDQQVLTYKIIKVFSNSKILWERHTELHPTSSNWNETHLMNAAYGRSYRWLWGHFVILDRYYSMQTTKLTVTVTARVFFARRKKFLERIMKEIEECSLSNGGDTIFVNMGDGIVTEKPKRCIDSIYTDDDSEKRILSDIRAFIENKDVYAKNSSPYKFVGLLSGTPGSGKTSTIHAIASELGMGIRFINTDKEDFETIARIMCRNDDENGGKRNIIVIEDIDCISMNINENRSKDGGGCGKLMEIYEDDDEATVRYKNENNKQLSLRNFGIPQLSLSSILNLLDGIVTPSGIIVFLTTNRPESLDAALLRDGRIDGRYDFHNICGKTANRMIKDSLGFTIDGIADDITPSSLQRDILKVSIGRMNKNELIEKYSKPLEQA